MYLLLIDTAVTTASVCIAKDGVPLLESSNPSQKDHAAWLHPAIGALLKEAQIALPHLAAVAVSGGPGSYTGLRVGMAAAKGLCYAAGKPLIVESTLQMMAAAAAASTTEGLLCPLIDARRMEVFTAVYKTSLEQISPPSNIIIAENPFLSFLENNQVSFFGNGCAKLKQLLEHPNARFPDVEASAKHLVELAFSSLQQKKFANTAYAEPFYGKAFYTPAPASRAEKQ